MLWIVEHKQPTEIAQNTCLEFFLSENTWVQLKYMLRVISAEQGINWGHDLQGLKETSLEQPKRVLKESLYRHGEPKSNVVQVCGIKMGWLHWVFLDVNIWWLSLVFPIAWSEVVIFKKSALRHIFWLCMFVEKGPQEAIFLSFFCPPALAAWRTSVVSWLDEWPECFSFQYLNTEYFANKLSFNNLLIKGFGEWCQQNDSIWISTVYTPKKHQFEQLSILKNTFTKSNDSRRENSIWQST